jgi:glycosyltransferase involved in cell wall biosynthesis
MKTLLIIPALNEEEKIGRVVSSVPRESVDTICVVDDGSSDKTGDVAKEAGVSLGAVSQALSPNPNSTIKVGDANKLFYTKMAI